MILNESDNLLSLTNKEDVSKRIEYLSRMCLLLPSDYRQRVPDQRWIKQHFTGISNYIKVRQSWLYAPQSHTLEDLRSDFHKLSKMFLTGLYGEFHSEVMLAPEREPRFGKLSRLLQTAGYLIPLFAMGFILLNPAINPGFNLDLLSLFFMAWLLIGIDRYLNLGILDSVLNLVRGLKDLS